MSLEQAAAHTRIPVAHLDALENDRFDLIPRGPYKSAYTRAYHDFLEIELTYEPTVDAVIDVPRRFPRRLVGFLSLAAFVAMLAFFAYQLRFAESIPLIGPSGQADPIVAEPEEVGQRLEVTGKVSAPIRLMVDGELLFDDVLAGGETVTGKGSRIEVEVEGVEQVQLRLNGERIVPQGRQDLPRRLVFVDDVEGP